MNLSAFAASLVLAYSGMLGLCLGMPRHWTQLCPGRPESLRRACLPLGMLSLALAVLAAGAVWPGGMALVGWFGLVSFGGLALLLLMPFAPRVALWLPVAGALLCGALAWG